MTTTHFELETPTSFRLAAAAQFYAGFTPMGGAAMTDPDVATLKLAFRLDGTFEAVGVNLAQRKQTLAFEILGTRHTDAVVKQVKRMLGLDCDAEAWAEVGRRDPVIGKLQKIYDGFFTAAFPSPYEAGINGILGQRISIAQSAALRRRLSETYGDFVNHLWVVPSPKQLLDVESLPGIPLEKIERLHGIARAALNGKLDADALRSKPQEESLLELEQLRGVGSWTAAHILFRGAGYPDGFQTMEPRVIRAAAVAYDLGTSISVDKFAQLAEGWRPFRTWCSILLVRNLARLGQFQSPDDHAKRGGAGRKRTTFQSSLRLALRAS